MAKDKKMIRFFLSWMRDRAPFLLGYVGFFLILLMISQVFNLERELTRYVLLLLFIIALLTSLVDLLGQWRLVERILHDEIVVSSNVAQVTLQERLAQVSQRVRELEYQVRQDREDLEDYYTMWAYQMKTPIAAGQLLVADLEAGRHKQALTQEVFKIEQYTGLVLNYLRLQSFHEDLLLEKAELGGLVHQVVKKFSIFFIQQQISLELGNLNKILVTDKKWFSLLLEQFLSNAVKYTRNGKISIYLDGEDLVIADTGIGIAKSDLERVFDRGFSGYNGRLTQQSSGLGLYLSRKIADQLGIPLILTSEVGVGTEIRLRLKQEQLSLD
ncbi:sensor histidine kinase [Streptococcus sp. X16XC17]|nr:sensor histidine kinase [Streptococcus sp. X16XC17]